MGHFSQACALTGLPVTEGDRVVLLPAVSNGIPGRYSQYSSLDGCFEGEYDGYGGVENVVENAFTKLILDRVAVESESASDGRPWMSDEFKVMFHAGGEPQAAHLLFIHKAALESLNAQFAAMDPDLHWALDWNPNLPAHAARIDSAISAWQMGKSRAEASKVKLSERVLAKVGSLDRVEVLNSPQTYDLVRINPAFAVGVEETIAYYQSEEGLRLAAEASNIQGYLYGVGSRLEPTRGGYQDPQYFLSRAIHTATGIALDGLEKRYES